MENKLTLKTKATRGQSETLRKLGYEWSTDYQVWASTTNLRLPALTSTQAHTLADSINDLLK